MSQCKGIPSNSPWPNGHGGGPGGGDKETNHENHGERVAPRTRRPPQEQKGENNFNFIQINLNRARQATYDLASYVCNIKNPVILAQEPNTTGKYRITPPCTDMCTYSRGGKNARPRVFLRKSRDKFWLVDCLSDGDCPVVKKK